MIPQPLFYASNNDPNGRVRTLTFIALWIVYCVMLAIPGYTLRYAYAQVGYGPRWTMIREMPVGEAFEALRTIAVMSLPQILLWAWFWFRVHRVSNLNSGRATSTYTSLLGISWFWSASVATFTFDATAWAGHWTPMSVVGLLSLVLVVLHFPRLSRLWPPRPTIPTSPPPPSPPAHP